MARLTWAEPALSDLEEVAQYIALDNPPAATRYVRKVFTAVERLEHYPNSGKRSVELPDTPYRELVVPPCRLFYRVEADTVIILYIMRSERLLRSYVLDQSSDDAWRCSCGIG